MAQTIFKKVMFKCAGCGKTQEAKAQVPVREARSPLAVPTGWGTADIVGQHDTFGAVTVLAVPVCGEDCGLVFMKALSEGADSEEAKAVQDDVLTYALACQKVFSLGAKSGGIDVEAQKAAQPRLVAVPGDDGFDAPKVSP